MIKVLLLANELDTSDLAEALEAHLITLCPIELALPKGAPVDDEQVASLFDAHPDFDGLIFAPAFSASGTLTAGLDDMLDLLAISFVYVKAALASFETRNASGRLISLLPGNAAMGDPAQLLDSTLAGAMLSLFRTLALELRKTPITANTLMYAAVPSQSAPDKMMLADTQSIAALISMFLGKETHGVNGQEIYAQGAADVGRLHP